MVPPKSSALPGWKGESATVACALAALVVAVWRYWDALGESNFIGGDGRAYQAHVSTYLAFSRPFEVSMLAPLAGMFNQQMPLNLWLNPTLIPFLLFDFELAKVLSGAVGMVALAAAVYVTGRSFFLGRGSALLGAQAACLLFSPLFVVAGMNSQYALVPSTAWPVALLTFAAWLLQRINRPSAQQVVQVAAGMTVTVLLAVCADPLFVTAAGVGLAPLWLAQMLSKDRSVTAARLLALVIAGAILWFSGVVEYLLLLVEYSARKAFAEYVVRQQSAYLTTALFAYPAAGLTYLLMAIGWALLLAVGEGRQRNLAWTAIGGAALIAAVTAVYLLRPSVWLLPAPLYFEHVIMHVLLLTGAGGFGAAAARLFGRGRPWWLGAAFAVLVVQLPLAVYLSREAVALRNRITAPLPREPELVRLLVASVAVHPGATFRGSAAFTDWDIDQQQTLSLLWRERVPTLNEYGQLVTPQLQAMLTRLMPGDKSRKAISNVVLYDPPAGMIQLLGVRYVIDLSSTRDSVPKDVVLAKGNTTAGADRIWWIRTLSDPNIGNYSPTDVIIDASVASTLERLAAHSFDYRKQVVMMEPVEGPLVAATDGRIRIERGYLHVTANSPGRSLLLLPVQFSHCLHASSPTLVKLRRANLLMTSVIFEKKLDMKLSFQFGLFSPGCRRADTVLLPQLVATLGPKAPPSEILVSRIPVPAFIRSLGLVRPE